MPGAFSDLQEELRVMLGFSSKVQRRYMKQAKVLVEHYKAVAEHSAWESHESGSKPYTLQSVSGFVIQGLRLASGALSLKELDISELDANEVEANIRDALNLAMNEIKSVYDLILQDQAQAAQLTKTFDKAKGSDFSVSGLFKKALKTWQAKAEKKVKPPTTDGRIRQLLITIKFWSQPSVYGSTWDNAGRISYPVNISLDVVIWSASRHVPQAVELEHQPRLYQERSSYHDLTKSGLMFHAHKNLEKLSNLQPTPQNGELTLYLVTASTKLDSPVLVIYGYHKNVPGGGEDVSHLVPNPQSTFPDFHLTLPFQPQAQLVYANPKTMRGFVSRTRVTWDNLRHLCQPPSNVLVATVCEDLPGELSFDDDEAEEEENYVPSESPKTAVTGHGAFNWWRKKFEKDVGNDKATKSSFR